MQFTSTVTLNSGYKIPVLGLGTYFAKDDECQAAVESAIKCGYRMIDTASFYGNMRAIGAGVKKCIEEGVIKREDLWITTKLWVTDWKPANMEKAIQQCLKDLQVDYLDLYLIHWPTFFNLPAEEEEKRQEGDFFNYNGFVADSPEFRIGYNIENMKQTWAKMEEFAERGLARSIGVSNFSSKKLEDLLGFCKIKPAMNQVELHPHLQQWELLDFCKKNDIYVTAYYPLGGAQDVKNTKSVPLMQDPVLVKLGEKYGKTSAQVMIRWAVQRGTICIPKSTNPGRILANSQVFDFEISEEDMQTIRDMDKRHRHCNGFVFMASPLTWKDLWDGENLE